MKLGELGEVSFIMKLRRIQKLGEIRLGDISDFA